MVKVEEETSPKAAITTEAMEKFRQMIGQESGLHVRTDDNFVLRHLSASDGDPQKAFAKMKDYYELKREYSDWYATEKPEAYREIMDMNCDYILDNRDTTGKRIWIHKPGNIDPSRTTISQLSCMHDLLLEMILDEPETQQHGIVIITDLKDFPWGLLRWISPSNARISAKKADSLPFPKMEYHIVNTSLFFNIALKAVYPFLSKKQKESIFNHGNDWTSLHSKVDPSCLPEEYGGTLPNVSGQKAYQQVIDYTDKLMVNLGLGYTTGIKKTKKEEPSTNFDID